MNLKEMRKRKGLTQMDAAAICGVSLTCWILWEREINTPNEENMVKVKQLEALPDKE